MGRVLSAAALVRALARDRRDGRRIVFTNGCFDLLHAGHLRLLETARAAGGVLVVGVNADGSVRRLKGPGRPLIPARERAELLAGLRAVTYVALFGEATPRRLIRRIRPDVLVKGADYGEHEIVGAREVKAWGGRVLRVPLVRGRSTSAIIRKSQ